MKMLGYPKYKVGDVVRVKFNNKIIIGAIAVVDAYGTFADDSDVSYDFYNKSTNMLYKHFHESYILNKIGEVDPVELWAML